MRRKLPERPAPPAPPEPPDDLSSAAAALWRAEARHALSPGRQAAMYAALQAWDRARQAAELIREQGMTSTTKSTGAIHVNPLVKVERDSLALFGRLWCDVLHFHWDQSVDGRP